MDHALLRSWLGLLPGPWPPTHYALLDLEPGQCDPVTVEALVLVRMERLRMHQLRHPELVTEGMNRLAQALICLTDSTARTAYDAELGLAKPKPPTPFPEGVSSSGPPQLVIPFAPGLAPPEVGPPADLADYLPLAPYELVLDDSLPLAPYELVPDAELQPKQPARQEPRTPPDGPNSRRNLFTQLAGLRRLLVAWRALKPVLADPREPLARPASVLALLEAVARVRPLQDQFRQVLEPGGSGTWVLTLLRQRFVLATFRTLLPEQRQALSLDWRRGELALLREHDRLREAVRSGRPFRRGARRTGRLVRWLARTPEVVLLVLVGIALIVARLRGRVDP